jgi:hypothetical protein
MTKIHLGPVSFSFAETRIDDYINSYLLEVYGITILGGAGNYSLTLVPFILVLTFDIGLGCLFSSTIIALQASVERKDIGKTKDMY